MIPKSIQKKLNNIKIQSKNNSRYYKDKLDFVEKVYSKYNTYDEIYNNVSRYQVYRVFVYEPSLIDKKLLSREVYNALFMLYDSALETL